MDTTAARESQQQFPCTSCGANLKFAPGTEALLCPYCGAQNQIAQAAGRVEELDFRATLAALEQAESHEDVLSVKCTVCGAESTLGANVTADVCPFCGSGIVATAASKKQLRPRSLLPFHITREQAMKCFRDWIAGLWFAPSGLARLAETAGVKGVYIPAWTYDCNTDSDYTGERGDDYWVTETYTDHETHTETVGGRTVTRTRPVTKTRQVRKTRWTRVSGRVFDEFDDVLVLASRSLPRRQAEKLEPWDLKQLLPYRDEYLSGFVAESYQVDLGQGFEEARQIMDATIRGTIRRDIGGDHQRIHQVRSSYHDITFKHLLLPVWISAYRYHEATYRFLVNARTGEVQGERPWSVVKIVILVLSILAAVLIALAVTGVMGR